MACSQIQAVVCFRNRNLTNGKLVTWFLVFYSVLGVGQKGGFYWNRSTCEGGVGRHQNCRRASASHVTRPVTIFIFMGVAQNQPIIIQLMQWGCCYLRSAIHTVLYMNLLHVLVGPSITGLLFCFHFIFYLMRKNFYHKQDLNCDVFIAGMVKSHISDVIQVLTGRQK